MGFFDSIKNALGSKSSESEGVKGPSQVLRDAGIDPQGLKFNFGSDGEITITGRVDDQERSDRIAALLAEIPSVSNVNNQLDVGPEPAPEPEPEPEPAAAVEPEAPEAEVAVEEPTVQIEEPQAEATGNAPEAEQSGETSVAVGASADGKTYTVQPGDSLWKIASEMYGSGAKYMTIFEANRDVLDDPDLIKPGQVLKIPDSGN